MPRGFATCLAQGVALFNAKAFHEAHEIWEEAWLQEQGTRRLLLQGLILVAAGWLKREAGNTAGPPRLFTRALDRLAPLPGIFEGLDVEGLRQAVESWRGDREDPRPLLVWRVLRQEGER